MADDSLNRIGTPSESWTRVSLAANRSAMQARWDPFRLDLDEIRLGGGPKRIRNQHEKGRMTAWERVNALLDDDSPILPLGSFAAYGMYQEDGGVPAAGTLVALGRIHGKPTIVVANDATIKAGAYFEMTCKKTIRAQEIALATHTPIVYLVDSAGVFLPRQDEVFPDEKHFGKIFYNNAQLSARGVAQIAAVMGPCVAGGAYLPLMCDSFLIVEGASIFLAGPALVKSAVGEDVDLETLGGATTHTAVSGIADYHEPNDETCLKRIRSMIETRATPPAGVIERLTPQHPALPSEEIDGVFNPAQRQYDIREILARLVDQSEFVEYKATYGKTLVTGTARIDGYPIGIIANQRIPVTSGKGELQLGGVIYSDSADKAARFIMRCNQDKIPLLFIHDVMGFMVGKDAEHGGIGKDGAKMVNAVSNSTVPKISLVIGGSYGAGNYAMCGKGYNPTYLFAWPTAEIAVMGPMSAAKTLAQIQLAKMPNATESDREKVINEIRSRYEAQLDPRYAAARLWVDEVIEPSQTRAVLAQALSTLDTIPEIPTARYGVLQT